MKLFKTMLGLSLVAMAASSQADLTIFDNNLGGTAKVGIIETGTGQGFNGNEPVGDPLTFDNGSISFDVSAGRSINTNLAGGQFDINGIDRTFRAYQDLAPQHGGLGAVSANDFSGDNLRPGNGNVNQDEVLFFNFDGLVTLSEVFFNGAHQENTFVESGNKGATDYFNIFTSLDGITYTSIFGGQQMPTNSEYLETGLTEQFSMYAIAASGWGNSKGGYVEAIRIENILPSVVPSPSTAVFLALGLFSIAFAKRKRS